MKNVWRYLTSGMNVWFIATANIETECKCCKSSLILDQFLLPMKRSFFLFVLLLKPLSRGRQTDQEAPWTELISEEALKRFAISSREDFSRESLIGAERRHSAACSGWCWSALQRSHWQIWTHCAPLPVCKRTYAGSEGPGCFLQAESLAPSSCSSSKSSIFWAAVTRRGIQEDGSQLKSQNKRLCSDRKHFYLSAPLPLSLD